MQRGRSASLVSKVTVPPVGGQLVVVQVSGRGASPLHYHAERGNEVKKSLATVEKLSFCEATATVEKLSFYVLRKVSE